MFCSTSLLNRHSNIAIWGFFPFLSSISSLLSSQCTLDFFSTTPFSPFHSSLSISLMKRKHRGRKKKVKMSNPPTPTGRPAKPMSSRLMTMKFMQRAASSAATAASSLPTRPSSTSSQIPPPPPSLHPSKRLKPSSSFAPNSSAISSFSSATPHSELQAMREALAAEEAKRSQALERQAADAGHETKWVLSTGGSDVAMGGVVGGVGTTGERGRGLWVRRMGYSEIDDAGSEEDADEDGEAFYVRGHYGLPGNLTSVTTNMMGRRSFGKFNRELEKRFKTTTSQQSTSSSDEAAGVTAEESDESDQQDDEGDSFSDNSNDPVGANDLIRASRKEAAAAAAAGQQQQRAKASPRVDRKSRNVDAAKPAASHGTKEVKLNRLSSISGGGGGGGHNKPKGDCYNCGEKGHVKKNCQRKGGAGPGAGRGNLKRKGGGGGGDSSAKRSKLSSSVSSFA